jgi:hypothetical protein
MLHVSCINTFVLWLWRIQNGKRNNDIVDTFSFSNGSFPHHSRASNLSLKKPDRVAMEAIGVRPKPQNYTASTPTTQGWRQRGTCRTADGRTDLKCGSCQLWACKNHSSKNNLIHCFKCSEAQYWYCNLIIVYI